MLRVDVDSVLNRKKNVSVQMFVEKCLDFAIYGGLTGLNEKLLLTWLLVQIRSDIDEVRMLLSYH